MRSTREAVATGSLWAAAVSVMLIPQLGMSAGASICLWWMICSVGAIAMHGLKPQQGLDRIGFAVLGASVAAWTHVYVFRGWMRSAPESGFHPGFGVAMLFCGVLFATVLLLSRGPARVRTGFAVGLRGLWVAVTLVLFASTSLELDRAGRLLMPHDAMSRAGMVSIWWGIFAAAMLTIGFVKAVPVVRHCGLALLGVATLKAILIDLAEVAPEWRVASFIGLGLLMLGVAVVYARVGKRLSAA